MIQQPFSKETVMVDRIVLTGVENKSGGRVLMTTTHTVEIENQDKPACVAEVLTMYFTQ